MGSPAYFGKLACFTASLRKPGLVAFGLFNPADDLSFIADFPGTDTTFSQASEVFASPLDIDVSAANIITVILTGDVASMTLNYGGSSTIPDGQWVYLRFVQDSTGGWTVVLPTNLVTDQGFAVDPGAGRVTILPIRYSTSDTAWGFFGQSFSTPG